MPSTTLLPGVYFRAEPERPSEILPRMDIAAFVGFAASGPVDTPVPVEDLDRFREIFGADLPLAWDRNAGRLVHAHLGPTVEAFFRNGGRRCWIVRVADDPQRHRFALPGLVDADDRLAAVARARAPGSWADDLRVNTRLERQPLPLSRQARPQPVAAAEGAYSVDLAIAPDELTAGELLELGWRDPELRLLLFVDTVRAEEEVTRVHGSRGFWIEEVPASPEPAPVEQFLAETDGLAALAGSPQPAAPIVHRASFEILVWRAEAGLEAAGGANEGWALVGRLGGLAFHPDHPRFWSRLPADDQLFALPHGRLDPPLPPRLAAFLDAASSPRFALAGAAPAAGEEVDRRTYLPLAMLDDATTEGAAGPLGPLTETRLERDGLAEFSASLFLDPDLTWASGPALLLEAEHKYYQRSEPLAGLHSLLPVDEPTLIAIPDATHPGWTRERPEIAPPLGPPELVSLIATIGGVELSWTPVEGAVEYRLEQSISPEFTTSREVARTAELGADVAVDEPCPRQLWFRVRATHPAELGPWSNTRTAIVPPTAFLDCTRRLLPGVTLELVPGSPGPGGELAWSPDPRLAGTVAPEQFEVQSSAVAGFDAIEDIIRVPDPPVELTAAPGSILYYRVRSVAGERRGPWSNTVTVLPSGLADWTLLPADGSADELLAVQRALLRLCAARRDLLALLAAPGHYREEELVEHLRRLEPGEFTPGEATSPAVRPLRLSEDEALGFAAFFHPWVTAFPEHRARQGSGIALDTAPPEGTVAGMMAAQAIREGAWIAPANVGLDGLVALAPVLDRHRRPELLERRINLLVQDARGFFVWNAETLWADPERGAINIRRLLILLRRLALREGNAYVFEPNHRQLRGLVRHRFERLLSDLFVRGAFAGATAEQAFRVVVDGSVNTPQTAERGQFIVELRVAPSQPMKFLHIRLVQQGAEQLSVQEI